MAVEYFCTMTGLELNKSPAKINVNYRVIRDTVTAETVQDVYEVFNAKMDQEFGGSDWILINFTCIPNRPV